MVPMADVLERLTVTVFEIRVDAPIIRQRLIGILFNRNPT